MVKIKSVLLKSLFYILNKVKEANIVTMCVCVCGESWYKLFVSVRSCVQSVSICDL